MKFCEFFPKDLKVEGFHEDFILEKFKIFLPKFMTLLKLMKMIW